MENASKALIIAGAILLAILLISLGIIVYRQASSAVDGNPMDQFEIAKFNEQFTRYQGTQRGATIRSLYQDVLSNNVSQDDTARQVEIAGLLPMTKNATSIPASLTDKIKTGASYKVSIEYGTSGSNKGLVTKITIANVT